MSGYYLQGFGETEGSRWGGDEAAWVAARRSLVIARTMNRLLQIYGVLLPGNPPTLPKTLPLLGYGKSGAHYMGPEKSFGITMDDWQFPNGSAGTTTAEINAAVKYATKRKKEFGQLRLQVFFLGREYQAFLYSLGGKGMASMIVRHVSDTAENIQKFLTFGGFKTSWDKAGLQTLHDLERYQKMIWTLCAKTEKFFSRKIAQCTEYSKPVKPKDPLGPKDFAKMMDDLLGVGTVAVALVAGIYFFGPILSEVGQLGADAIRSKRKR